MINTINDFKAKFDDVAPVAESFVCGYYFMVYLSQPHDSANLTALIAMVEAESLTIEEASYEELESGEMIKHQLHTLKDSSSDRLTALNQIESEAREIMNQMIIEFLS